MVDGAAIRLPDFNPEDGCLVGAGVEERRRGTSLDVVLLFILKSTRWPALGATGSTMTRRWRGGTLICAEGGEHVVAVPPGGDAGQASPSQPPLSPLWSARHMKYEKVSHICVTSLKYALIAQKINVLLSTYSGCFWINESL